MLLASSGVSSSSSKTYIDDLFSAQLRTGTGSTASITTGFQPDLIWTKSRSATTGHRLVDSVRGAGNSLESNSTLQQQSEATGITAFSSSGYSIGTDSDYNTSGAVYVDWCWKKAPKFFDIVTYTGNGVAGRQIPHNLGVVPGIVIVKQTNASREWGVYHRSLGATKCLQLESTGAAYTDSVLWNNTEPTSSVFTVGISGMTNAAAASYVAYLFAHDASADGVIQCGSYVGTGTVAGPIINLGWEPQYILIKNTNTATEWVVYDNARGMPVGDSTATLYPNTATGENTPYQVIKLTATGFQVDPSGVGVYNFNAPAGNTFVYMAIRRSNKPPTAGTQVFQPVTYVGDGVANRLVNTGILTDFILAKGRASAGSGYEGMVVGSRLTGNKWMKTALQQAEQAAYGLQSPTGYGNSFSAMDGFGVTNTVGNYPSYGNLNANSASCVVNSFKRAPGVFDAVCFTTATSASTTIAHNLTTTAELIIVKERNLTSDWFVYVQNGGVNKYLKLNADIAYQTFANTWAVSSTGFGFAATGGTTAVAYLFATKAGISKVGSYTGNGSSQTINCGFSTGARFILIKRTDSTGDWYVWDTARGIVSANDPHLSLNTTAAEVTTDDSVDPDNTGFIVNQVAATNINVNNATYIYLAIA